ncbi:flagellar hook-length control protein FliK [Sinirhodobacter huangdaonensis]|nr:flagellar hook-length control protein FliK [Sinirhodobacter huangdaonensis]
MRITVSMPDNPAPATKTEPSQTPAPAEAAPAPVPPGEAAPDSRTSEAPVRPITTAPAGAAPAMAAALHPPAAAADGVDGVGGARSAPAGIAPDAAPQPQPAPEQAGTGRPAPETGAQTAAAPAAPPMAAPAVAGRADPLGWTAARPEAPARAATGPTATEPHSPPRAAVRPPADEGGDAAGQTRATAAAPGASGPDGPVLAAPAPTPTLAPTPTPTPTPAGREIGHVPAHHVLRQLHEAVVHRPDGPVEVALSPEELGRVRLTLHPAEHGITVAVQAERPETLDLMRRNIEMLARDFRDLGYTDVSFSFGAESGRQQRGETAPDNSFGAEPDRPAPATPTAAPPRPAPRSTDGSLDLRM